MTLEQTLYGIGGMLLFLPILYYVLQALEHFVKYEEMSMRVVFEEGRGITAFRILAASYLVYAFTLIVSGYGNLAHTTFTIQLAVGDGNGVAFGAITNLERIGGLLAAAGTLHFTRTIARLSDV